MLQTIVEGLAKIKVPLEKIVSRKLPVFYNPIMKFNRDISVLLLNAVENKNMQIGSPLAGSGVREIRFLLELAKDKIKSIAINDINLNAYNSIKENLALNGFTKYIEIKSKEDYNKKEKIKLSMNDANKFMLNSSGFDYIDIDPFGSPNPFLNNAIARLARDGILAVTATDTACLAGSTIKACLRKYWAMPLRNEAMHENGLRILIRKVQLIGADNEKALIPIFSYFKDHYFRIFFRCEKGKQKADDIIKQHGVYNNAGPLWTGKLWDTKLVNKMINICEDEATARFLRIIEDESKIDSAGFYNIPLICKKNKLNIIPQEDIIKKIEDKGFRAAKTHFKGDGIRSNISLNELIRILKNS